MDKIYIVVEGFYEDEYITFVGNDTNLLFQSLVSSLKEYQESDICDRLNRIEIWGNNGNKIDEVYFSDSFDFKSNPEKYVKHLFEKEQLNWKYYLIVMAY